MAFLLFFMVTFAPYIEALRVSVLALVWEMDSYPLFVRSAIGLIWGIVAALLSSVAKAYLDALTLIALFLVAPLQFGVPATMLIMRMRDGVLPKKHWVGIVMFIVISVGYAVYYLLSITGVL
jgi:hypothetical protein